MMLFRGGFDPLLRRVEPKHFNLWRTLSSTGRGDGVLEYWKSVLLGDSPQAEQTKAVKELCSAAISVHLGRSQNLFPDELISLFRTYYCNLDHAGKKKLFSSLASNFGVDEGDVTSALEYWQRAITQPVRPDGSRAEALLKASERLHQATQPMFNRLWHPLSQDRDGLSFLVDLRGDLLQCISEAPTGTAAAPLKALSEGLRRLLVGWFTVGLMKLERVEWERTSGSILEKIALHERVHRIKTWEGLKRRLAPDRRVFIWHHPSLPQEPLVVLHVALCQNVPDTMDAILNKQPNVEEDGSTGSSIAPDFGGSDTWGGWKTKIGREEQNPPRVAAFYSISSTKPGLTGVDLGNNLIKAAAKELLTEIPSLTTLATLSPIPGFAAWLDALLIRRELLRNSSSNTDKNDPLLSLEDRTALENVLRRALPSRGGGPLEGASTDAAVLRVALQNNAWVHNAHLSYVLKRPMLKLTARYLITEKHRGRAFDPVANFHLRNGAYILDLNWGGDLSRTGLERSYGIMVNYGYDLSTVEENNRRYLVSGKVAVSDKFSV